MASVVVIVPKDDEVRAVKAAFDIEADAPVDRLPSGTSVWRTRIAGFKVAIARLDVQTNTYSGIRTLELIHRENPRQLFLTGTALGKPGGPPVGSVIVAERVGDVSERRPGPNNPDGWIHQGPHRGDSQFVDAARDFVARNLDDSDRRRDFYRNLGHDELDTRSYREAREKALSQLPDVAVEPVLSGNEYLMTDTSGRKKNGSVRRTSIWELHPQYKAYDMEAAGFVLAANLSNVPWMVFRGISDHGTVESKMHRPFPSHAAATVLRQFLEADPPRVKRISSAAPRLPGALARRLSVSYVGYMGFVRAGGHRVIYREDVVIENQGEMLVANIVSRLVEGTAAESLVYRAEIRLGTEENDGDRESTFSGIWAPGGDSSYAGSLTGRTVPNGAEGVWTGGYSDGVRVGRFIWYNRESMTGQQDFDETLLKFQGDLIVSSGVRAD